MRLFLVTLTALSAIAINGQVPSKSEVAELLRSVKDDQRHTAECQKKTREEQTAKFGKPLPSKISHCFTGDCPISIPNPWYPPTARQNKIRGEVVVDALVDEQGKVAYVRLIKGPAIFRQPALTAAYHALHQPKQACGRPIKFWWRIQYNFIPD